MTLRVEDGPLLRGQGRYLADLAGPRLHAAFVRSAVAHGRVVAVDTGPARSAPGVVAVLTAADLGLAPLHGHPMLDARFTRPPLAEGEVRFVGDPLAVVVAETAALAVDAAELVVVDVEPLPVVQLGDDTAPLAWELTTADEGAVIGGADRVVRGRFVNQRVAAAPMEPDGAFAIPDGDGVVLWASTQRVHNLRDAVAQSLGIASSLVRVRAPNVGRRVRWQVRAGRGGGRRRCARPKARAARDLGADAPREPHGHAARSRAAARGGARGRRGRHVPRVSGRTCSATPGRTRWSARSSPTQRSRCSRERTDSSAPAAGRASVLTNTTPMGAYRGAGRPEACALLERLVDLAAVELGVDPVDLRRRNLVDTFPHRSPTGVTYDAADYRALPRRSGRAHRLRRVARRAGRPSDASTTIVSSGSGWRCGSIARR